MGLIYTGTGLPRPSAEAALANGRQRRCSAAAVWAWCRRGIWRRVPLPAALSAWQERKRNRKTSESSTPPAPEGGRKANPCSAFQLQGGHKNPAGVSLAHSEQLEQTGGHKGLAPR